MWNSRGRSRFVQWAGDSSGQSMVEFALSLPLLVFLTIGSFAVGAALERHLTVGQLVRHAGNMYARDVEFDDNNSPARTLVVEAGGGLKLSTAKGTCDPAVRSVVYLTQVQITPDQPPGTFANEGEPVMIHRTLIGNGCIDPSAIGTPPSNIWDPNDPVDPGVVQDPYNEPGAVATVPASVTNLLEPGETVFIIEVIHKPQDLLFPGFLSPTQLYTMGFF